MIRPLLHVLALLAVGLALPAPALAQAADSPDSLHPLPNTLPLTWELDDAGLADKMMDGAHRYVERKIAQSIESRPRHWDRDLSSGDAYNKSVQPNREHLKKIIGVVEDRQPVVMQRFGTDANPALVAQTPTYRVYQVRWPVLEGVFGEGLLVEPRNEPLAHAVVLPDADQTPEQTLGLAEGIAPPSQLARRLAENGFQVLIPTLISRDKLITDDARLQRSDQTHREWVYRQAYHMGRHVIGYEVQKVLAAVDWIEHKYGQDANIGVAGYGEGGLIAFYAAALDTRIDAALVSGYFNSRQNAWAQPIYRNIWGLLREFGDAEIATLLAPRPLIIEYSKVPEVTGQKGELHTPDFTTVAAEFERIESLTRPGFQPHRLIHGPDQLPIPPGSPQAARRFAQALSAESEMGLSEHTPSDRRESFDPAARQLRQVAQMEDHVQQLVRRSAIVRDRFFLYEVMPEMQITQWSTERQHKTLSPKPFIEGADRFRRIFHEESMGRFDGSLLPPNARTRRIHETDKWTAYDVVLDVFPDLFAWGVLLVPKDIAPGEQRPVVVCQHGRNGLPAKTYRGNLTGYYNVAAKLADRGFITFSPHNLYRGEDRYRYLDRKANTVEATLFSFIIPQHKQILSWLDTLDFVDGDRIGFYGLSYGGETAVRVPAVLEKYALSICAGDFNQWTRKVASTLHPFSFMRTIEWEMPYFNLGQTFDYAEMAYLIFPRPFMVERGHDDLVAQDRWVAHEYAKVRRLYNKLGLPDKTAIDYFNGGHAMLAEGTFDFLHKHLDWPKPQAPDTPSAENP